MDEREAYEQGRDDESILWNTSLHEATQGMRGWHNEAGSQALDVVEAFALKIKQALGRNRRASERAGRPHVGEA